MIKWINIKIGTRFWYSVTIIYWVKGVKIFDFNRRIGIPSKSTILNRRNIVGSFHDQIYHKNTKKHLNNGYVSYEVSGYLGWFKG